MGASPSTPGMDWCVTASPPDLSCEQDCPQCRRSVSSLWCYRLVDGSYSDYLVEQPVDVLVRAPWFRHSTRLRTAAQGDGGPLLGAFCPDGWTEEEYHAQMRAFSQAEEAEADDLDEDGYDDLDTEDRLLSSVRLGNRSLANRAFGAGGFVSSGRKAAKGGRRKKAQPAPSAGVAPDKAPAWSRDVHHNPKVNTPLVGTDVHRSPLVHTPAHGAPEKMRAAGPPDPESELSRVSCLAVGTSAKQPPSLAAQGAGADLASTSPPEGWESVACTARGRKSAQRQARKLKKLEVQQQKAAARAARMREMLANTKEEEQRRRMVQASAMTAGDDLGRGGSDSDGEREGRHSSPGSEHPSQGPTPFVEDQDDLQLAEAIRLSLLQT